MWKYVQGSLFTKEDGTVLVGPERKYYPNDIEGDIEYMRAVSDFKNAVTSAHNAAFEDQFKKAIRGKSMTAAQRLEVKE